MKLSVRAVTVCAVLIGAPVWQGCQNVKSSAAPERKGAVAPTNQPVDKRGPDGDLSRKTPEPEPGPKFDPNYVPTQNDIDTWVESHKNRNGGESASYGYVHLPLDLIQDKVGANLARIAIFKTLNHVSLSDKIYTGEDISEGRGIAYAIDYKQLWPERSAEKWNLISQPLSGGDGGGGLIDLITNGRRDNGVRVKGNIISVGNMDLENVESGKSIEAARFVYNATFPNVYNFLIDTPGGANSLVRRERVGNDLLALAAHKEAIVNGPRVSAFFKTQDGRYYVSTSDYFANFTGRDVPYLEGDPRPRFRGNTKIVDLPGGTSVVSESYIQARNGCIQYFIWGAGTQERGRAELVFVADPQNHSRGNYGYLTTGRSCISCHVNGVQAAKSVMPDYIEQGKVNQDFIEEAKQTWTSNEELNTHYQKIGADFRDRCMAPIVNEVSNGGADWNQQVLSGVTKEPVLFMIRRIEPENQRRRRR